MPVNGIATLCNVYEMQLPVVAIAVYAHPYV
jgi:hypothetical protein